MKDIIDFIEEGKVKRFFRSRNKYYFKGAISHITQHATGNEPLFLEESDYLYMLHLIKETSKGFGFSVLSFVLMLTHLHLLINLNDSELPIIMKHLFQRYALYFNDKYKRKGHVFSGAYRSALCLDETYLMAVSLYIHFNPVRAGLVENPSDYRWSSCALFVDAVEKNTFIDYKFILSLLDGDLGRARLKYKDCMNALCSKYKEDLRPAVIKLKAKSNQKGSFEEAKTRKLLIEKLRSRGLKISEISKELGITRQSVHKYLRKLT